MFGDTNIKIRGRFSNGAVLYKLLNLSGQVYWTICESADGETFEVFSAPDSDHERMIDCYSETYGVEFRPFESTDDELESTDDEQRINALPSTRFQRRK